MNVSMNFFMLCNFYTNRPEEGICCYIVEVLIEHHGPESWLLNWMVSHKWLRTYTLISQILYKKWAYLAKITAKIEKYRCATHNEKPSY